MHISCESKQIGLNLTHYNFFVYLNDDILKIPHFWKHY